MRRISNSRHTCRLNMLTNSTSTTQNDDTYSSSWSQTPKSCIIYSMSQLWSLLLVQNIISHNQHPKKSCIVYRLTWVSLQPAGPIFRGSEHPWLDMHPNLVSGLEPIYIHIYIYNYICVYICVYIYMCVCDHIYCNPYRGEYIAGIYNWLIIWCLLATDCTTGMQPRVFLNAARLHLPPWRCDGLAASKQYLHWGDMAMAIVTSTHGHFEATKNRDFIKKWMKHELI